jgi:transcriptional regulator with XRE-family HTH domain
MTGAQLRATRKDLGMTQAALAKAFGVSLSQLHNWERGEDRRTGAPCPVPRLVELACQALSCGEARPGH